MYARLSGETTREEEWNLPCCIIVELEERNGEEFHVFGNSKDFCGVRKYVGVPRGAKERTGTYCALASAQGRVFCIL